MSLLNKKNVCFITGSRAEYGLLENIINLFREDKSFKTFLIVTGSHLSKKFGTTINNISKKNVHIKKIPINLNSDSKKLIYLNQKKLSQEIYKFYLEIKPTCFIVLGDRFEIFSLCSFIQFLNVPIVHIHGGEKTSGSLDDQLRHCISKMSHVHFVANKEFQKRVLQLGENKKTVYVVGGLGVDKIKKIKTFSKSQLKKKIKFYLNKKNVLITLHPDTLKNSNTKKMTDIICKIIKKYKSINFIITYPNFDSGYEYIINEFKKVSKKYKNVNFYHSLGDRIYLSLLKYCDLMLGNSSSGFTEAPYFNLPVLNIGDRQFGRPISKNITNSKINFNSLDVKLKYILKNNLKIRKKRIENKYGKSGASKKIYNILRKFNFKKEILKKKFNDL